jgi:hypothetical protein
VSAMYEERFTRARSVFPDVDRTGCDALSETLVKGYSRKAQSKSKELEKEVEIGSLRSD